MISTRSVWWRFARKRLRLPCDFESVHQRAERWSCLLANHRTLFGMTGPTLRVRAYFPPARIRSRANLRALSLAVGVFNFGHAPVQALHNQPCNRPKGPRHKRLPNSRRAQTSCGSKKLRKATIANTANTTSATVHPSNKQARLLPLHRSCNPKSSCLYVDNDTGGHSYCGSSIRSQ